MLKEKEQFLKKISELPQSFDYNNITDYKNLILLMQKILENNESDQEITTIFLNTINTIGLNIEKNSNNNNLKEKKCSIEEENALSIRLLRSFYKK